MSIASDIYAYAQLYEYYVEEDFSVWEGRDGTKYHVKRMDTSHVQNCLNMLRRNKRAGKHTSECAEWERVFMQELRDRGCGDYHEN